MWFKNNELLLATGRTEEYIKQFDTVEELMEDFSQYKTINYQLGVAMLNLVLAHFVPSFNGLFDRIISIEFHEGGIQHENVDIYHPTKLFIETDKGTFTLDYKSYSNPDGDTIKLKTPITIGSEKEIMIYSVANWIKQLMK